LSRSPTETRLRQIETRRPAIRPRGAEVQA
jgi:hypothetical protein